MVLKYSTTRTVYEHTQDHGAHCGRASAQMVMSSLLLWPPSGKNPTPAEQAKPLPVSQDELRTREVFPNDDLTQESWKTHPDELLALLAAAREFTGTAFTNWRLAVHATDQELLGEVALVLKDGMPAILNLFNYDHWAVVIGVGWDEVLSRVQFIEVLDPQPVELYVDHTYVDVCAGEGTTYADPDSTDSDALGGLELKIDTTLPPPSGLNDYRGQCVAVVHGPLRDSALTRLKSSKKIPTRPLPKAPRALPRTPIDPASIDAMRTALLSRAHNWEIPRLTMLLASPHDPIARFVQDIKGTLAPYHLLSLYSPALKYGVVGVFDVNDHQPLHFRFTNRPKFAQSLERRPGETLWWTKGWLPTLRTPYFPFARTPVGNKLVYQRLFDDFEFELGV